MGIHNITGWSGGGRRPLTYGLKAGQFRNMGGASIFGMPTSTIINNNFGNGYGYYDNYGYDSGVPKWMQWTMGFGMISQLLGGFMSMFAPRAADGLGGAGGSDKTPSATDQANFKNISDSWSGKCTIKPLLNPDGSYKGFIITDKTTKLPETFTGNLDDLQAELQNRYGADNTADAAPTQQSANDSNVKLTEAYKKIVEQGVALPQGATLEYKNNKYVLTINNTQQEYDNVDKLIEALKTQVQSAEQAQGSEGAGGAGGAGGADGASGVTHNPTPNDGTWYDLFKQKYEIPAGTQPRVIKLAACRMAQQSTGENGIQLNQNGTISTKTNWGPTHFSSINLPNHITVGNNTFKLKS